MTAHELAKELLNQPDYPVVFDTSGGRNLHEVAGTYIDTKQLTYNNPEADDGINFVIELTII